MGKDGGAQRAECRRLVNGAIRRAQALVDETLQVGNQSCSCHIPGSRLTLYDGVTAADPGMCADDTLQMVELVMAVPADATIMCMTSDHF